MIRILFGQPGDFASRHPRAMLAAVIALVLSAEWIADTVAQLVAP